ncbi:unnamed protein product [Linum tenue]|uniref:SAM domain-containing protein n=1 Tax=Linum tenue TaxID=586396 RepID=A0AAV0MLW0_9ROSI|nr:unnamed protein product [Linum tenue]
MQPPESHLGGGSVSAGGGVVAAVIPAGGPNQVTSSETVGSKRQRRPSVRLGDIGGDQLYDPYSRKATSMSKSWKQHQNHHQVSSADQKRDSNKGSKTRALTNLSAGGADYAETLDEDNKELNLDRIAIGSWRVKEAKKRAPSAPVKRVRSSWVTKIDETGDGGGGLGVGEGDGKYSAGEDMDDYDDAENSDAPSKEQSPVHSLENLGDDTRGGVGYRDNEMCDAGEDGVRIWLNNLGLGRYAPVFEIHEVDDEVLPMLTLEDLKDMGINAVGSRRKMFSAIQKLSKGFS